MPPADVLQAVVEAAFDDRPSRADFSRPISDLLCCPALRRPESRHQWPLTGPNGGRRRPGLSGQAGLRFALILSSSHRELEAAGHSAPSCRAAGLGRPRSMHLQRLGQARWKTQIEPARGVNASREICFQNHRGRDEAGPHNNSRPYALPSPARSSVCSERGCRPDGADRRGAGGASRSRRFYTPWSTRATAVANCAQVRRITTSISPTTCS